MNARQDPTRRDDLLFMLMHGGAASNSIARHVVDNAIAEALAEQTDNPIIVSRFDVAMEAAPEEEQILTIGAVTAGRHPVALLLDPEDRAKVGGWLLPSLVDEVTKLRARVAELEGDPIAYGPTGIRCGCGKDAHSNLVPCRQLEDPHDGPNHHDYALGRDLPFIPGQRDEEAL